MITLSPADVAKLRIAKDNCKKYQYGTLYRKSADKSYKNLTEKLAAQYGCNASDIETAFKES